MQSRNNALLLAGLACALSVAFSLRLILDPTYALHDVQELALLPALFILMVVLIFQQQLKRQELATQTATVAVEVTFARERAQEQELLVVFGKALAEALDLEAVKEVAWRHVPTLTHLRDAWILVREPGGWKAMMGVPKTGPNAPIPADIASVAATVLAESETDLGLDSLPCGRYVGFPMVAAGAVVGVLGVAESADPLSAVQRRVLAAASALLAIALRNVQLFAQIREGSVHDALTGCLSRGYAQQLFDVECRRAQRSGTPLSALMCDIDHFKEINDQFGHQAGDAVLSAIGHKLRDVLRGSDISCRYGGEEFLIIMPDTPSMGASHVADSLRRAIQGMTIPWDGGTIPVTASFGVATLPPSERDTEKLVARADASLYRAKEAGRNCVRVDEDGNVQTTSESGACWQGIYEPTSARPKLALVAPRVAATA
jgi:diguanylate cyclase (GGDEF)-like protein